MSILWCGGEDIDFPNGAAVFVDTTNANFFRNTFSRCGISCSTGWMWSKPFPGGSITSGWLSGHVGYNHGTGTNNVHYFGLVNSASGNASGLWVGEGSTSSQLGIYTFNGTTFTLLAQTTSSPILNNSTNQSIKIDVQVISYGASGTVNLFFNGAFALTFTGNIAVSGVSNLDTVAFQSHDPAGGNIWVSELIVSSTDTRSLQGLVTMAPNGNGTTQNWSNPAFTNFNPIVINDANSTFVNTTGQDEQATLIDLPSGNFSIPMVKIAARALATSGATATNLKLGVNNGGTVAVASPHALTTGFNTVEDFFSTDPTTSVAWVQSQMNGLQLDLRSA